MPDLTPISAVSAPDPYPYYAGLVAERPFGYDDELGMWVAASAAAVREVLRAPGLRVRPPSEPVPHGIAGTPAGEVFGDLVRMTDTERSRRLKSLVASVLATAEPDRVTAAARDRTARALKGSATPPLRDLMFSVPAQVVAVLCGLDDGTATQAGRLTGVFVGCIPASATPAQQAAAAKAAAALRDLLSPELTGTGDGLLAELARAAGRAGWSDRAPLLANGIGLLSQTYDATAGLIGNTLLALAREGTGALADADGLRRFAAEVARHDAPVQNTRRFAAGPLRIGEAEVAAGDAVLVVLAAANRDPAVNPDPVAFRPDRQRPAVFTFGEAAHGCPGASLAMTIACAVIAELFDQGFSAAGLSAPVTYQPLANARIPVL